jgi:hypothetical protein
MRRAASAAARRSEFADTCGASGSGEAGKREFAITFRKASCVPASPPITNPARLRFDEFELDEANARLMGAGKRLRSRLRRSTSCAPWPDSPAR